MVQIYLLQQDYASAYTIACYQQATRPMDADIVRDAGVFLYYLKRIPGAAGLGFLARGATKSRSGCMPLNWYIGLVVCGHMYI